MQSGFGAGNAFDTIHVNDGVSASDSTSIDNNLYGLLVPVSIDPGSFTQFGMPFASQQPGFIVDGGDEATPGNPPFLPGGVADDFFVHPSTDFNIQVNGNLPTDVSPGPVAGVPQGDQLNVSFPCLG